MIVPGSSNPFLMLLSSGNKKFYNILVDAGLTSNIDLCFDAGDSSSYSGTGQTWNDLSLNLNNFYLGEDGTVNSIDPTFIGSSGDLSNSTYWALDGNQYFHNAQTNATFIDAWHKDNAQYTIICGIYLPNSSVNAAIIGGPSSGSTANIVYQFASGAQNIYVENSSAGSPLYATADNTISAGWHMLAISIDEPAGVGFFYCDGNYDQVSGSDTFNATYASPASGASANTYNIGWGPSNGGGANKLPNGSRIMTFSTLNKAASKLELDSIWDSLKIRLGI